MIYQLDMCPSSHLNQQVSFIPVTDQLLQEITQTILSIINVKKIILFGSYARGTAHSNSDLDLLVIEDEPFGRSRSRLKESARIWKALIKFYIPKDIVLYSQEEVDHLKNNKNHVVAQALKEGKLLYERK